MCQTKTIDPVKPPSFENTPINSSYGYEKSWKVAFPQIIATSIKNLLLIGYGMTLGFPTILIPAVSNPQNGEILHLDEKQISWISSINLIVVPVGCAISGLVTNPIGRRRSMQIINIPFLLAWLIFSFSTKYYELYIALIVTGLSGGILEAPVLTYVAEITQPHLRGALSATSSMCIIIGVFTQFLLGNFYYWRTVALINISVTIIAMLALFFVPESPHWLVSKGRIADARKSLQWLRGWTTPNKVDTELIDIQNLFKEKSGHTRRSEWRETLSHYTDKSFLVPYFLVAYAFFVGHFSGMTTLQTYAVYIFNKLQSPIDKYYATLILGIVQIVGSLICVTLVHYTGKRPLTLISTFGVAICCAVVAGYDYYINEYNNGVIVNQRSVSINTTMPTSHQEHIEVKWIPTIFMLLIALLSHIGIRLLPWMLIGEVFSAQTRASASGLTSAIAYIFGFLSNKLFLNMVNAMEIRGTYGLYSFISLSGMIVLYFILPETEGKNLGEIQNHFAGIRKMDNSVYKSKRNLNKSYELKGETNKSFTLEISKL